MGPAKKRNVLQSNLEDLLLAFSSSSEVHGGDSGPEIETHAFLYNGSDGTLYLNSLNTENNPRSGYEVALNVMALDGDHPILLDKVWTDDRLPISKRSVPSDEGVSQWPHLKGIKFPRFDSEEKAVGIRIGNDVPEAHWVFEERRGRRKQPRFGDTFLNENCFRAQTWQITLPVCCSDFGKSRLL